MQREAIHTVDGQEILNYRHQSIQTFVPGHRLECGPFGTMGVGLPFAVGAKAAKPPPPLAGEGGVGSQPSPRFGGEGRVRGRTHSATRTGTGFRTPI
jgi:thiamine pyrophosphate-dependent acetolactate synthase large subunit-like protein